MAQQDIRYYLNGLLLEVKEKNINIVGTDGHRLSFTSLEAKSTAKAHKLLFQEKLLWN